MPNTSETTPTAEKVPQTNMNAAVGAGPRSTARASRHLVSIGQAAEYAGVSSKTIRRRIADGSITGYRMGKRLIRIDLDQVDAQLLRPIPTSGGLDGEASGIGLFRFRRPHSIGITKDHTLGVGYATFSTKPIAATVERDGFNLDIAADGSLVGIEVLDLDDPFGVARPIPPAPDAATGSTA